MPSRRQWLIVGPTLVLTPILFFVVCGLLAAYGLGGPQAAANMSDAGTNLHAAWDIMQTPKLIVGLQLLSFLVLCALGIPYALFRWALTNLHMRRANKVFA
jgi:hypothetical protein